MIKNKLLFIGIGFFLLILSSVLTLFQILRTDISSTVVTQQHSNKQLQKQQDVITGTFISQHNFLGMIVLPIQKTDIPYDEIIEFRIRKETDTNWYYSGEFETARVNNLDYYPLGFPVVTDSANQHFYFEIEKVKKSNANPITFNLKNDYFQTKYQYPTQTLLQDPVQLFTFFTAKTQYAIANEISSFTFIINFIPFFIFIFWRYIRMLFVLLKKINKSTVLQEKFLFDSISRSEFIQIIMFTSFSAICIYWDFLRLNKIFIQHIHDFYSNLWPNYIFIGELIKSFEFPVWSFSIGLGTNIFAGNFMRVSLVDPFTWLTFLPNANGTLIVIPFILVLKIICAGTFFYIYLRKNNISHLSALAFGIAYAISGQMILRSPWYHYTTEMVFIPLLLISIDLMLKNKKMWPVMVCFIWLGCYHLYHIFLFGVFTFFYVTWKFFLDKQTDVIETIQTSWKELLRQYVTVTIAALLGLAVAAFFVLPNIFNYFHSARWASRGLEKDIFYGVNSLFVDVKLFFLILIKFFGNGITGYLNSYSGWANSLEDPVHYSGLLSLVFFFTFPFYFKQKRIFFWTTIGIIAAYFFIPSIRNIWNVFYGNRFKTSTFFITPVMLLIAAFAFDYFIKKVSQDRVVKNITIALLGFLYVLVFLIQFKFTIFAIKINFEALFVMTFVLCSFIGLLTFSIKKPAYIFVIISTACMIYLNSHFIQNGEWIDYKQTESHFKKIVELDSALQYVKEIDTGFYRIDTSFGIYDTTGTNDPVAFNYAGMTAYQSFNEASLFTFTHFWDPENKTELGNRVLNGFSPHKSYLRDLLVQKYFLSNDSYTFPSSYTKLETVSGIDIYRNEKYIPFGTLYSSVITTEDLKKFPDETYEEVVRKILVVNNINQTEFQDLNIVTNPSSLTEIASPSAHLQLKTFKNTQITGTLSTAEKGIVLFQFPYNKGWNLIVNGEKQPLFEVNKGLTGAVLPPGDHKIELNYRQPYLLTGIFISATTLSAIYILKRKNKL